MTKSGRGCVGEADEASCFNNQNSTYGKVILKLKTQEEEKQLEGFKVQLLQNFKVISEKQTSK